MNFVRSRLSVANLLGQRSKQAIRSWNYRGMCNKPLETKTDPPPPTTPAHAPRAGFKLPGYRPSEMDKRFLLWSGRFKSADQIPELVSFETIDAARNKIRVKACYLMMVATIGACVVMVILGKRAVGRHESLIGQNMEKKAQWKEELMKEKEAAITLSEKAQ
ncbi:protein FAM162B [Nelusetta ayraudi]|uniref:protein FAM162B n=1 Tax=Nelusetta ayraudi TaxID=303726 RepID=UPI003F72E53E